MRDNLTKWCKEEEEYLKRLTKVKASMSKFKLNPGEEAYKVCCARCKDRIVIIAAKSQSEVETKLTSLKWAKDSKIGWVCPDCDLALKR